jgi:hypothetical protein
MKKLLYILPIILLFSCKETIKENPNFQTDAANPEYVHRTMKKVTDVIVHDIFSPPVASRIYAYVSITGYETMLATDEKYKTLAGQLTDFKPVPKPSADTEICYPVASIHAMLKVGKTMIFSEEKIDTFEQIITEEFRQLGVPQTILSLTAKSLQITSWHGLVKIIINKLGRFQSLKLTLIMTNVGSRHRQTIWKVLSRVGMKFAHL